MIAGLVVFLIAFVVNAAINLSSGYFADRATFPDEYDWKHWRKHREYRRKP